NRTPLPQDSDAPDPRYHRVAGNATEYEYGRLIDVSGITLPDQAMARALPLTFEARSLVFTNVPYVPDPGFEQQFQVSPIDIYWWPEHKNSRIFNDFGELTMQRDDFGRLRRWTYDPSGNIAEYTDFDGGKWSHNYGKWHFLPSLINPIGAEVRFTYTTCGN